METTALEIKPSLNEDIEFVKTILPETYTVKESKRLGSIHCSSPTGIREGIDGEDDEHWGYVIAAIKTHFGKRFMEIYHNTCTCHVDFTIYLRQN